MSENAMNWNRCLYGEGSAGPGPQCDASVVAASQASQFSPRGQNRATSTMIGTGKRFSGNTTASPGPRYMPPQAANGVPTKPFSSQFTKTTFNLGRRFVKLKDSQMFGPAKYMPAHPGTFASRHSGNCMGAAGMKFRANRFSSNTTIAPGPGHVPYRPPKATAVAMSASARFPSLTREQKEQKRLGRLQPASTRSMTSTR